MRAPADWGPPWERREDKAPAPREIRQVVLKFVQVILDIATGCSLCGSGEPPPPTPPGQGCSGVPPQLALSAPQTAFSLGGIALLADEQ